MQVQMGNCKYEFPSEELGELRDSNDLLGNREALETRMAEDGYLMIRGLHDREAVLKAGDVMIDHLAAHDALLPGSDPKDCLINPGNDHPQSFMGGRKGISHNPEMLAVLEGKPLFDFFETYFGEQATTFDYKWLRAQPANNGLNAHYDWVYMGRGSQRLCTIWTPLCDVPIDRAPLALCVGSHNLEGFEKVRNTYGKMDVDNDHVQGSFSNDPREVTSRYGGVWQTTEYEAGDVLIFGMHTMHGALMNVSGKYRLSTDVRFQPAKDPIDERWIGENPIAHYGWGDPDKAVSMEDAKASWGI